MLFVFLIILYYNTLVATFDHGPGSTTTTILLHEPHPIHSELHYMTNEPPYEPIIDPTCLSLQSPPSLMKSIDHFKVLIYVDNW